MTRDDKKAEFETFDARVKKLRETSGLAKDDHPERRPARTGYGSGVQAGIELVAGVVGGAFMGYWLDRWLETWPLFFLILFFLGAAAGTLNAYRYVRRASEWREPPSDGTA